MKLEGLSYKTLKKHDRIFIRLDTIPERGRDGRKDRRNPSGYYSALHCEQCGHAVKTRAGLRVR